jgi:hypothetical protein
MCFAIQRRPNHACGPALADSARVRCSAVLNRLGIVFGTLRAERFLVFGVLLCVVIAVWLSCTVRREARATA